MTTSAVRLFMILSLLALVLVAGSRIFSQEPAPVVARPSAVAFVDMQAILERSRAVSDVLDVMDKSMASEVRAIQEKEARFSSMRFDFERQQDLLSREEREKRRLELGRLNDEIERLKFDLDRKWRAGERQIEPLIEKIMDVVADVAKREGYDVVVRGEIVIYGKDTSNLTARVIEELDSRSPEIVEMFSNIAPIGPLPAGQTPAPEPQVEEPSRPREILPAIP
jgi:outer membrane protein